MAIFLCFFSVHAPKVIFKNIMEQRAQNFEYLHQFAPQTNAERARRRQTREKHAWRRRWGFALGKYNAETRGANRADLVAQGLLPREIFETSRWQVNYWTQKWENPLFHPGTWGGSRDENLLFGSYRADRVAQAYLFMCIALNPGAQQKELVLCLRDLGGPFADVTISWVQRRIASWGWSWRKTRVVSLMKYTEANVAAWTRFAVEITTVPWEQLVFIDEASFVCFFFFPRSRSRRLVASLKISKRASVLAKKGRSLLSNMLDRMMLV